MSAADDASIRPSVNERYRALLDIGRTLTATLSPDDLYAVIHRETANALEASGFYIALYDQARDLARIVYCADRGEVREVDVTYRGSDSEVIRSAHATVMNEGLAQGSLFVLGDDGEVTKSGMSAPLIHNGRVIGSISAQSYEVGTYSDEDLDLLQGIADVAAVAIENALQFSEIERRRRESEQIEEIGRALTSELDPQGVLGKVADAVLEVLDVDGAAVWLSEEPNSPVGRIAEAAGEVRLPIGLTWDLTGELESVLIGKRAPVVIDDLASSKHIPEHVRQYLTGGSATGVPITVGDQVAGVLAAGSRKPRRFGKDETDVLKRLARQSSVALGNARLHADVRALSLTDPLTGLPNRRRLHVHLEKEIAAARRGRSLTLVIFDIDNFKRHNDTYGHVAGDEILRQFAQILVDENRQMNLVGRYGGDEFVSVLSESDMEGARQYMDRVSKRLKTDPTMTRYDVEVSIGVAEFDRDRMESMEDLLQQADLDMYSVKADRQALSQSASP